MSEERRRRGGHQSTRTTAVHTAVQALAASREHDLGRPLRVLDLGGGTGGMAVPLAEAGHHVTVVDPSPDALASLRRRAHDSGVEERITAVQGDSDTLDQVVGSEHIDLVTCHGTLEVVDDPAAALAQIGRVLGPGGYLSIVAAQRLAVVLARALAGQFRQAQQALTSADGRWGEGDPLPRRFDADHLRDLVEGAGLAVEDVQGVRIFADLVPSGLVETDADRAALRELEQTASRHPDYGFLGELGAAVHVVARRRG
ncbi:MAG: methyltransferase domain-containing protein [Micrococcales bacterium]|nr:methyltransferase domain-containing protein [Micrococcales bacterium]